jgi:autotransporter-associated beta strand protein
MIRTRGPWRVVVAAAAFLAVPPSATAQTFTWDGGAGNGSWSAPANWDTTPTPGAGTVINLAGTVQTVTAQDVSPATPFDLNQLLLAADAANGFTVGGGPVRFTGGGAAVQTDAAATLRVNSAVTFGGSTAITLTTNNTAGQELILGGSLSGSAVVTVGGSTGTGLALTRANNTAFASTLGFAAGAQTIVSLGAHNAVWRATVLDLSGASTSATIRAGTTTATGAGFADAGFSQQVGRIVGTGSSAGIQVGAAGQSATVLAGFLGGDDTYNGAIVTSGAASHVGKVGTGTLRLTGNSSLFAGGFSVRDGAVILSGGGGSINNGTNPQGAFGVYAGATLRLDNGTSLNQNRVGNTALVGLAGGTLRLDGNNGGTAGSELIGNVALGSGQSVIEVNPTAGRGVRFNITGQFLANPTATVFLRGAALGSATWNQAAQVANITVTGTVPTLTGGILPFAVASEANAAAPDTFVTHGGANGFRPLTGADYTTFASATAASNVSDGGFTVGTAATVNALRTTGPVTLNANLTLTAGALLNTSGGATIGGAGTLLFGVGGAGTAYVTTPADLVLAAPAQAAHLAKSGGGALTVQGAVALGNNAVAAVNAGTLAITTGAITAANGTLTYQVSRGATLDVSVPGLTLASTQTLTGAGTVAGTVTVGSGATVTPSALGGPDASLASPGTLTTGGMVWQPGGTYRVYLNSAFEGDYTSGKIASPAGSLDLTGLSAANRFNIRVDSLALTNADGPVYDFDPAQSYAWTIATFGGGIAGFSPDKFTVNTADFANSLEGGTFSVTRSGNDLLLTFTPVPEPTLGLAAAAAGLLARRRRRA